MASPKGLGKGLDALFQEKIQVNNTIQQDSNSSLKTIPLSMIRPGPFQPRKTFANESIDELANSIKNQGLLQPILVRHNDDENIYEIIAGERRYLACKKAGITEVPSIICNLSDDECMVVALVENLQREDLSVVEEARALEKIRSVLDLTQEELAKRVGKSRPHVANTLRLLQLEDEILDALQQGNITPGHGRALLAIGNKQDRLTAFSYVLKKKASVREAEKIATIWKKRGTLPGYCLAQKHKKISSPKPEINQLSKFIRQYLGLPTKIKGDLSSGQITIKYSTNQELKGLLQKLNLSINLLEENVSHETTRKKQDIDTSNQ